jgi:hypothetical protein
LFISSGSHLKNQFQSELRLPRRAGFTHRKARISDTAEGRGAYYIARLAEVRMVEEAEVLGPATPLGSFHGLPLKTLLSHR